MSQNGPPSINITNVAQATNQGCGSGCGGCLAAGFAIVMFVLFIGAGYLLGSWVAVAIFGAREGSTAAVAVGWIFEIVYLIILALIGGVVWRNREKWFSNGDGESGDAAGSTILGEPPTIVSHDSQDSAVAQNPSDPQPVATDSVDPVSVFCHQCGASTREGAKFCSSCGATL